MGNPARKKAVTSLVRPTSLSSHLYHVHREAQAVGVRMLSTKTEASATHIEKDLVVSYATFQNLLKSPDAIYINYPLMDLQKPDRRS